MRPEASPPLQLVLASASPRRRELIKALDLPVRTTASSVAESASREGETPRDYVSRVSLDKVRRAARRAGDAIVLAADTAVAVDGEVLGKPADADEAARMLRKLRGRGHTVVTGVAAVDGATGRRLSVAKSTEVAMRCYSDREIADYVASGSPLDKAGAYGVQDQAFRPAEEIDGCYLNVVGLPLCEVVDLLEGLGVEVRLATGWRPPEECHDCPLAERQGGLQA